MRITWLIVLIVLAGCSSSTGGAGEQSGPTLTLVCSASSGEVSQDKPIMTKRLKTLGADVVSIASKGPTLTVKMRGITAGVARPLCGTGRLQARRLVAPPVPIECSTECSNRLVTGIGFAVPTDENQYARLSAAQQHSIAAALAKTDCAAPNTTAAANAAQIACNPENPKSGYLFGSAVLDGADVASAQAVAPVIGGPGWTVTMRLTAAGRRRWAAYTTAHNTNGASAPAQTCGPGATPCADFVGFVVDGVAVSVPLCAAPVTGGRVQISATFTRLSSRLLATQLGSGPLPVALRFVSAG